MTTKAFTREERIFQRRLEEMRANDATTETKNSKGDPRVV